MISTPSMKRIKGFTLVEVMVSVVILALLASGLFSVFVSTRHLVARSKRRLVAMEIARQEIELNKRHIRADRWDNSSFPLFPANGGWRPCASASYADYTIACRVDPPDDPNATYRKVTVRVSWDEPAI